MDRRHGHGVCGMRFVCDERFGVVVPLFERLFRIARPRYRAQRWAAEQITVVDEHLAAGCAQSREQVRGYSDR